MQQREADPSVRVLHEDSAVWVVVWVWACSLGCTEVLDLHFLDELNEDQSREVQTIRPNSCAKPAK